MNIHRQNRYIPRFFYLCLLALAALSVSSPSRAEIAVGISVTVAPPALPVYVQPPIPAPGYIWTPGYWAYGPDGYYWVPGTWVMAPQPGLLWTPGYWGWSDGAYIWHSGYWGPHVGFYGGVNYGYGYTGMGFYGGEWRGRHFFYNRSVSNVTITNVHVYNRTVVRNVTVNRVSYNGGPHGVNMRPTHAQEAAMHERHFEETRMQMDHEHGARGNREFLASVNHGRPAVAATARPAEFHGRGVVPARDEHARPMNNNRPDNHAMNRPMPHPQNAPRPDEHSRPVARDNMGQRNMDRHNMDQRNMDQRNMDRRNGPGPVNHNNVHAQNGPNTYRPPNAPHQNAPHPQYENAPRAQHQNAPHPQHENAPRAQHGNGPHPQHEQRGPKGH